MKRLSLLGFAGVLATLLTGCPIYDDQSPGGCPPEGCGTTTGGPTTSGCDDPQDCGLNETCGSDNQCHTGDCTLWGCASGFECVIQDDLTASCEPGGGAGGGGGGTGGGGEGGGGDAVYCGNPDDCTADETCSPDGTCKPGACDQDIGGGATLGCIFGYVCTSDGSGAVCQPENPAACGEDADCSAQGSGYLCVSGICTAPADQCFDQTQCPANDKCVDGKCTPSCTADADCGASYTCNVTLGICTIPAVPCVITNDCGGPDSVCVNGACVPRSDGATCPAGSVWVENGCIPNQSASFVCGVDGQQDVCADGSLCLHHSCYISCESPNDTACDALPSSLNQCKPVTTVSGPHQVCGSSTNLGNECYPTLACEAGKFCIDGYCK